MTRTVYTALAAAIVFVSTGAAGAFTLASPVLPAPTGGSLECTVYNHSLAKTMTARITILDGDGAEVSSSENVCNGLRSSFCFRVPADASAMARARACRFEISGVARSEARAAILIYDAQVDPVAALEAR